MELFGRTEVGCQNMHSGFISNMAKHGFLPIASETGSGKAKAWSYDFRHIFWIYVLFKLSRHYDFRRFFPFSLHHGDRAAARELWGLEKSEAVAKVQEAALKIVGEAIKKYPAVDHRGGGFENVNCRDYVDHKAQKIKHKFTKDGPEGSVWSVLRIGYLPDEDRLLLSITGGAGTIAPGVTDDFEVNQDLFDLGRKFFFNLSDFEDELKTR